MSRVSMLASSAERPMLATLKKGWPLTRPRSIRRVCPAAMTLTAASRSASIPSVRARSLAVPVGRMPSGRPVATSPSAAAFMVPSPPATATRSTSPPCSRMSVDSCSRVPHSRCTGAMPCAPSISMALWSDALPLRRIRIAGDSTFALLLEAQARGHRVLYYVPDDLSMRDGRVVARVQPIEVRDVEGDHFTLGESTRMDLAEADVVLMRQEPPFDMAYVTATHMLERIHPKTLVVNDPAEVRNAPEKLFVTHFPQLMP